MPNAWTKRACAQRQWGDMHDTSCVPLRTADATAFVIPSSLDIRHSSFILAPCSTSVLIREKPDFVRERLATRGGGDEAKIEEVLRIDAERRKSETELQRLQSERNRLSKEIGAQTFA